ncbi:MAG: Fic family protein [Chloroflexi bacterium]|nr:Fic family protein [Chloroflexota bacterium]MBI2976295.1 Fic family protein [Chloroflexota bacterium]MBI5290526.1 Fic family protein [Chloroflexota bacterium]
MQRGITGRYEITNIGSEQVRAFIPHPLPPNPPLDLSNGRQRLLERATLALGRLDSITLLLPDPNLFLYAYVRREAVLSSQIEGTQSSLADLLLFELEEAPGVPFDDVVEVSNYVAALEHGMKRLREGFPLSNRLIREMHATLLSRGRGSEKSPGEFRRTQNWIGGTRPGNAHFVPPPPAHVEDCMAALERFIHDEGTPCPALVMAALAHVQFETLHPFLDGNGRIGRLLIAFVLHHGGALSKPLLYLSLYFKQHRAEYYRLLDLVRMEGDWEAWLDFFLEGVENTASNAVQTAQRLLAMFREDADRVQSIGRAAASALRVFNVLRERPLVTLNEVHRRAGISFPTATKGMNALVELGIVRELTGRRRNRVFAYDRYLSILNEGIEPL